MWFLYTKLLLSGPLQVELIGKLWGKDIALKYKMMLLYKCTFS